MIYLNQIFRAGRVRRWHANADLSHTDDYVDGHQGRVARIILALHPEPSPALIAAALTHDDGEWLFGDIPNPGKQMMAPAFRDALEASEAGARCAIWGDKAPRLTPVEAEWLRLADRLDAFMWALYRHPDITLLPDWQQDKARLEAMSIALGCTDAVALVIGGKARMQ